VTVIRAGSAVLDGRICRPGWLVTDGRRVRACGPGTPPQRADVEFSDAIVVPGFVDMHVHGGDGASYADAIGSEISRAAAFHRQHGTTTTLASLVSASAGELVNAVRVLADMAADGAIAGIHLEGPWLSRRRCGAHDRERLRDPDPAEIDALLSAGAGNIRMATLAPERAGSSDAIKRLVEAGVVVALGHTDAPYEVAVQAIALGATIGTHIFNGMPQLHHREPGPAVALLEDPRVTVELIADGVHVHPAMMRWVIDTAGPARVAVISDATAAAGLQDGSVRFGRLDVDVVAGVARVRGTSTIAGSTATMDEVFRNVVNVLDRDSDESLRAAVQMSSTTPARALGLDRVGTLRADFDADLVVLSQDLQVLRVMAKGVWQNGESRG
jgi:N-acetylglucosamine-6-phosphate deacetylase